MQTSRRVGWLFGLGVPLMILALVLQTITLASQDYRTVLVIALALILLQTVVSLQLLSVAVSQRVVPVSS